MPVHNPDVVLMFEEWADLLELLGENPFRIRAYRNAARTVEALAENLGDWVKEDRDLSELPGIGKDLAAKIREFVQTGQVKALNELRSKLPAGLPMLLRVPGLGPKRVKVLYDALGVSDLAQLRQAAKDGRVRDVKGLGEKTELQILETLDRQGETPQQFLRAVAEPYALALLSWLRATPGVTRAEVAGSYRRHRETVGDLDFLATARPGTAVMDRFTGYDEVDQILARGDTKSSVRLRCGIQADLRVVEEESFGSALLYFTGSKAHNIALRKLGQDRKLKLNEYGLFDGNRPLAGRTEEDIYAALELDYITPELREDRGEVDLARTHKLPELVAGDDIRGDLHAHTTATDGKATLAEMAEAARRRGYQYLAITDHSKRLTMVHGLDEDRLRRQVEEIDRLNETLKGITLLKGIECDILEDGSLDLSDEVLGLLDLVIGSVHSKFKLTREQQTARILRAMDHPYFTFMAHPTGRLLLARDPYEVDVPRVIRHARERGCALELNAHPQRLDLNDHYLRLAREEGVPIVINTDAHSTRDLDNMSRGIGQARRGGLTAEDVWNTRPLRKLRPLLASTRSR